MATVKASAMIRRDIETYRAMIRCDIETYRVMLQADCRALACAAPLQSNMHVLMDRVERAGWVVAALGAYLVELERTA